MTTLSPPAIPFEKDPPHRRLWVGNEPHVLHCHHYNTFLQQTIQDAQYLDTWPFLVGAAQEVAHHQLSGLFDDRGIDGVPERTAFAAELYRWAGFGSLDLDPTTLDRGKVTAPTSHYSSGWRTKMGLHGRPVDLFTTGWIAGALSAIHDAPSGSFGCVQTRCIAMGAPANEFEVDRSPAYATFSPIGPGPLTQHRPRVTGGPIDAEAVYEALTSMNIRGDEDGIIAAFGVYLTHQYANYYNRISFEFVNQMRDRFGVAGVEMAEPLLVESGHVCAFNTFGGIMTSPEWDGLVRPNLQSRSDWVFGITAAVNALGWGRWEVTDATEQGATFVIHDDYESVGHLGRYGTSDRPVSYLAQGAAAGIMNLVYVGNVENRPVFDASLYQRLFRSGDSFVAEVTGHRTGGAEVTTIEVSR